MFVALAGIMLFQNFCSLWIVWLGRIALLNHLIGATIALHRSPSESDLNVLIRILPGTGRLRRKTRPSCTAG